MSEKIRVAVLLGGDSSEREVSFRSGVAMAQALSSEQYNVTMFDVATAKTRGESERTRAVALGDKPPFQNTHPWTRDLAFWLRVQKFIE